MTIKFEIIHREILAARFHTRNEACLVADVLNERPTDEAFLVEFRDNDWYSIEVRQQGRHLGYVKLMPAGTLYYVSDYPGEGATKMANASEHNTLDEARAEVVRRLGDVAEWRRWDGIPEDGDVEAYHESPMLGCGGCCISREPLC